VITIFKWLRARRGKPPQNVGAETEQADRDSGEEEYESEEEYEDEVAPSDLTRAKTDNI
jgi:hypothetical protein